MKNTLFIFALSMLVVGCNSPGPSKDASSESSGVDSLMNVKSSLNDNELSGIMESIPSPLELSSLIQNSGAPFSETFLNKTENAAKYNSQFSKSVNLGIYGADLGYINLYQKTFSAMDYLNTVYQLSNDLSIGEFFDFDNLKRLATNNSNLDSIVYITTTGFERMHKQLKKTHNSQISVLILVGGWIEGLHLTSEIVLASNSPNAKELMNTVYDERIVLEDILKLVNAFNSNPSFSDLSANLENLKKIFSGISPSGDAKADSITPEQFRQLAAQIKSVRNKLTE